MSEAAQSGGRRGRKPSAVVSVFEGGGGGGSGRIESSSAGGGGAGPWATERYVDMSVEALRKDMATMKVDLDHQIAKLPKLWQIICAVGAMIVAAAAFMQFWVGNVADAAKNSAAIQQMQAQHEQDQQQYRQQLQDIASRLPPPRNQQRPP